MSLDCYGDTSLIGDKTYLERCRAAADGIRIRVFPGVPRTRTVALYQSYSALLFPLQWDEPFGLTVAEASACGLPVLTLTRGAMRELVKDGENGWAVDDEDALEELLKSGAWREQIGPERARAVARRFSLAMMVDTYEKLYQEVAHGDRW